MRILLDDRQPRAARMATGDDPDLDEVYAFPDGPWVRANFVSTLDGSAVGPDHLSGSINTPADKHAYAAQRRAADVILVGAGTARAEHYRRADRPMVVVSQHGHLPQQLLSADDVILATCAAAGRDEGESVWVCGTDDVDLAEVRDRLIGHGWAHILCEGGPSLFASALAAGIVDELALTLAPRLVAGPGTRITAGDEVSHDFVPVLLLEEDGTVLGLWRKG